MRPHYDFRSLWSSPCQGLPTVKSWVITNDLLEITDGDQHLPVSAEQVYASVIENVPAWDDLPGGKCGDASDLKFSRFPADLVAVIEGDVKHGEPCVGFEARTQQGDNFPVSWEAVRKGHVVHADTWYPIVAEDRESIVSLLDSSGVDLPDGRIQTLKGCLVLKKAAWEGWPVIDRLSDESLNKLLFHDIPGTVPEGILAELYPYQLDGWRWLRFIIREEFGGLLGDEMGLGKTLQVISALRDPGGTHRCESALVVAPGSLLENWVREIAKFSPDMKTCKHHGAMRTGNPVVLQNFDIVITSYAIVIRDLSLLKMIHWDAVILDEAQNIKNPEARRTKAVKKIGRRVALAVTGTPVENRLRDLWSIMDFVAPGFLGDLNTFEAHFGESEQAATELEPLVSPLLLRRRIADHAQDLPERIDIPETLELRENEAEAYELVRKTIAAEYGATATLVSLTKLRQFCAHPEIVGAGHISNMRTEFSKFERLMEILSEIFSWKEKVLVFTSYKAIADRIANATANRFRVMAATFDGRLEITKRQPLIDRFTDHAGPALLVLNPQAGGTGLNIATANHIVHYNPEWNPAVEDQASARAYRRGQQRPVTVRRLILAGTIEEVINERLRRKRQIADKAVIGVAGRDTDYADIVAALQRSPFSTEKVNI